MHPNQIIADLAAKPTMLSRRLSDLHGLWDRGTSEHSTMPTDARSRVRQRIKWLLEKRGQTGRAFGEWMGHKDQWVSNLLAGRFALSLDEIDRAASFLNIPPSDLIRVSDDDGYELSPSERRVVSAMRMLPAPVRDHLMLLADYLVGVTPAEVELLAQLRKLTPDEIRQVTHWTDVTLFGRYKPPTPASLDAPAPITAQPASPPRRIRRR